MKMVSDKDHGAYIADAVALAALTERSQVTTHKRTSRCVEPITSSIALVHRTSMSNVRIKGPGFPAIACPIHQRHDDMM